MWAYDTTAGADYCIWLTFGTMTFTLYRQLQTHKLSRTLIVYIVRPTSSLFYRWQFTSTLKTQSDASSVKWKWKPPPLFHFRETRSHCLTSPQPPGVCASPPCERLTPPLFPHNEKHNPPLLIFIVWKWLVVAGAQPHPNTKGLFVRPCSLSPLAL